MLKLIKAIFNRKTKIDKWIEIPVWQTGFQLLVGLTPDEVKSKYPDFKDVEFADSCMGKYMYIRSSGECFLWLKNIPSNLEDINTLTHEAFHITVYLLEGKGVKFDINNHEQYAYLNGYINQKIFETLCK